jgi:protein-disulfide isomerase
MDQINSNEGNGFIEKYATPIAILVGAGILAVALTFGTGVNKKAPVAGTDGKPQAVAVDIKTVKQDGPFLGEANAPTSIAVYEDYQCPFCKQFDEKVLNQILTNYVATGKTKVLIKDFQFLGQDSQAAALFSRALWEVSPKQYAAWYKAMYAAQDEEGDQGFGDLPSIEKLSIAQGIDVVAVEKVMNAKKAEFEKMIAADRAEGASYGINGTPSVIAGKKLFTGMSPEQFYAGITAEIESELKK